MVQTLMKLFLSFFLFLIEQLNLEFWAYITEATLLMSLDSEKYHADVSSSRNDWPVQ